MHSFSCQQIPNLRLLSMLLISMSLKMMVQFKLIMANLLMVMFMALEDRFNWDQSLMMMKIPLLVLMQPFLSSEKANSQMVHLMDLAEMLKLTESKNLLDSSRKIRITDIWKDSSMELWQKDYLLMVFTLKTKKMLQNTQEKMISLHKRWTGRNAWPEWFQPLLNGTRPSEKETLIHHTTNYFYLIGGSSEIDVEKWK